MSFNFPFCSTLLSLFCPFLFPSPLPRSFLGYSCAISPRGASSRLLSSAWPLRVYVSRDVRKASPCLFFSILIFLFSSHYFSPSLFFLSLIFRLLSPLYFQLRLSFISTSLLSSSFSVFPQFVLCRLFFLLFVSVLLPLFLLITCLLFLLFLLALLLFFLFILPLNMLLIYSSLYIPYLYIY